VIDKAAGTVKSRLHRAGRRLRVLIEKEYPDLRLSDD
jgi:DNA-directed RNA polymerase specialized sigma24 family protein